MWFRAFLLFLICSFIGSIQPLDAGPKTLCSRALLELRLYRAKLIPTLRTSIDEKNAVAVNTTIDELWAFRNAGYPRHKMASKLIPYLDRAVNLLEQSLNISETPKAEMESLSALYKIYFLSAAQAVEPDLDFYSSIERRARLADLPIQKTPNLAVATTLSRIRQIYFAHEVATMVLADQARKDLEGLQRELRKSFYLGPLNRLRAIIGTIDEFTKEGFDSLESYERLMAINETARLIKEKLEKIDRLNHSYDEAIEPLESLLGRAGQKYVLRSSLRETLSIIDEAIEGLSRNSSISHSLTQEVERLVELIGSVLDDDEFVRFTKRVNQRVKNSERAWSISVFSSLRDGRLEEVTRLMKSPPFARDDLIKLTEPSTGESLIEIVVKLSEANGREAILKLIGD